MNSYLSNAHRLACLSLSPLTAHPVLGGGAERLSARMAGSPGPPSAQPRAAHKAGTPCMRV
jgi:hypothetical protein